MKTNFACVLAGGLGTRLRALYSDRPKALVPLLGRPFMTHQIEGLKTQGIRTVHIAGGYRADQLRDWASTDPVDGVAITVSVEPEPLGTAGGIRYVQSHLPKDQPILIMNGDSLLPQARIADMEKAFMANPELNCVISTVEMLERGQYGTVDMDDDDKVVAFKEKSTNDRGWVNGGIYLMNESVIHMIPATGACSIEKDIFPTLAENGSLGSVRVDGPLLDIGTPEGLERTTNYLSNGNLT